MPRLASAAVRSHAAGAADVSGDGYRALSLGCVCICMGSGSNVPFVAFSLVQSTMMTAEQSLEEASCDDKASLMVSIA